MRDRLYVSKKTERLSSIENFVDTSFQELEEYTKKSKKKPIAETSKSDINGNTRITK